MSNLVKAKTRITNLELLNAATQALDLPAPKFGEHTVYTRTYSGYAVHLPTWTYPVVFDLQTGQVAYDNHDGNWGQPLELHKLEREYSTQALLHTMAAAGHTVVSSSVDANGVRRIDALVGNNGTAEQHVVATVALDGRVSVEGIGFVGEACQLPVAQLANAVGVVESTVAKQELYETPDQQRVTISRQPPQS